MTTMSKALLDLEFPIFLKFEFLQVQSTARGRQLLLKHCMSYYIHCIRSISKYTYTYKYESEITIQTSNGKFSHQLNA